MLKFFTLAYKGSLFQKIQHINHVNKKTEFKTFVRYFNTAAVVGGSIAGSMAAIELAKLGKEVTVFEKSSSLIGQRGTGIMLPHKLISSLITMKIFPENFSCLPITSRPIYRYNQATNKDILITSHPLEGAIVNWAYLYNCLNNHLSNYHNCNFNYATKVTSFSNTQNNVTLTINNSAKYTFDFCIFADGYRSIGRQHLFPKSTLNYAGYIAWRGISSFEKNNDFENFKEKIFYYVYPKGHLLFYIIPASAAPNNVSEKVVINWVIYESIDKSHPFYNNQKTTNPNNITMGNLTSELKDYLLSLINNYFPENIRAIINQSTNPFIQTINDVFMEKVVYDNICLIGDASTLLRPHVGSGATKAIQSALDLGLKLHTFKDPKIALKTWEEDQIKSTKNLYKLGKRIGELFVTNPPDWNKSTKDSVDKSWDDIVNNHTWYAATKP